MNISSSEFFVADDEDPQPAELTPFYHTLHRQLEHTLSTEYQPGDMLHVTRVERRRPQDYVKELRYQELTLLAEMLGCADVSDHLYDDDTYIETSLATTRRTWMVRVENVKGYVRTVEYDVNKPERVEIKDEVTPDTDDDGEYALTRKLRELSQDESDRLQDEIESFAYLMITSNNRDEAEYQRQQKRTREIMRLSTEQSDDVAALRSRRFGGRIISRLRR